MDFEMNEQIRKMLDIPYVKLHFELELQEDALLPVNKASALRGGMGQMLLRSSCVVEPAAAYKDRRCSDCRFRQECIVQRIMYAPFKIRPPFVTEGESIGFVLDCEDFRREYSAGDLLRFDMTLFGSVIVYFYQILQAFYMLGQEGLGSGRARFRIRRVTSTGRQILVEGNDIDMRRYQIRTLAEYVEYRLRDGVQECRMKFHTPACIKYMKSQIMEFQPEAVMKALCRRIYMMDCFEGIEAPLFDPTDGLPLMIGQSSRFVSTARFSERREEKIPLSGIKGTMDLENIEDDLYALLLAGEIIHIGKNTRFGFGRYTMVQRPGIGSEP